MKGLRVRLVAATLAFAVGIVSHKAILHFSELHTPNAEMKKVVLPSDTFEGTRISDMFMEFYVRESDGANVRFGCSDRSSEAAALKLVRWHDRATIVETTDVLDEQGHRIGERVVSGSSAPVFGAEIEWNEGSRLFHIYADSLEDARVFEVSKVWREGGCWDFSSFK